LQWPPALEVLNGEGVTLEVDTMATPVLLEVRVHDHLGPSGIPVDDELLVLRGGARLEHATIDIDVAGRLTAGLDVGMLGPDLYFLIFAHWMVDDGGRPEDVTVSWIAAASCRSRETQPPHEAARRVET
jgi:hypothetical protein